MWEWSIHLHTTLLYYMDVNRERSHNYFQFVLMIFWILFCLERKKVLWCREPIVNFEFVRWTLVFWFKIFNLFNVFCIFWSLNWNLFPWNQTHTPSLQPKNMNKTQFSQNFSFLCSVERWTFHFCVVFKFLITIHRKRISVEGRGEWKASTLRRFHVKIYWKL